MGGESGPGTADKVDNASMPTFDLSQHDELAKWLQQGTREGVNKGLLSAAQRLVGVIQNELIPAERPPPVFDAHYRDGWHAAPVALGAEVWNDMPYAGVIDGGARAANIKVGRKMVDALAEWARRKGLTGHAAGKRSSPEAYAAARSIAWAIARAMQTKGIFNRDGREGLQIAEKAKKRAFEFVGEEVERQVRRALR